MPIFWDQFETQLTSYLQSHRANSEKDTAEYIADKYDSFVNKGKEQFGNGVETSNKKILENFIYLALLDGRMGKP